MYGSRRGTGWLRGALSVRPVSGLLGLQLQRRIAFPCIRTVAVWSTFPSYRCGGSAGIAVHGGTMICAPASRFTHWPKGLRAPVLRLE